MENKEVHTFKPINIKKVFVEKNPGLAKMIPGFVYSYISRVLHLKEINDFLKRHGHLKGIEFVDAVVKEFNVKEHLHGIENIPESGRFIFASNHPLGGFDAMMLMRIVDKNLGGLKFITNDILMNIPQLSPMFVPVNKHGGHSRDVARILNDAYDSNVQILIFPSGLASRKIKGKVVDLEWKKHFITKAIKHKRDIIPVFVAGKNSNRFYRIASLRKFFKIKWNIEMFFLPDETLKHRNKDVHIYFGKPVPYKSLDKSRTNQHWAEQIKKIVYNLPYQK